VKITEHTTLAELALERARLGVISLAIVAHDAAAKVAGGRRQALAIDAKRVAHLGVGDTEAEAIADAFAKVATAQGQEGTTP
jgi:hypothetical protein